MYHAAQQRGRRLGTAPVARSPEQTAAVGGKGRSLARRAFYRAWRLLPGWGQRLALRVAAPKVSLGACAIIEDARGRILVAHHTYRRRPWGLPGGLIRQDEQPAMALERELREELGVPATVGSLLYASTYVPGRHLTLYYRATIAGLPRHDGVEIDGFRYVTREELSELPGMPALPWLPCSGDRTAA